MINEVPSNPIHCYYATIPHDAESIERSEARQVRSLGERPHISTEPEEPQPVVFTIPAIRSNIELEDTIEKLHTVSDTVPAGSTWEIIITGKQFAPLALCSALTHRRDQVLAQGGVMTVRLNNPGLIPAAIADRIKAHFQLELE